MLYPKNKSKKLDKKLFENPTSEYRGTPFWAWNCKLDKEDLLWQIDVLKEMGFGGFHMHSRAGMATPYLTDEFMDLIKSCRDKAEKNKMLCYLYDEDRWPSGAAGGLVTKDKQYRARYLLMTPQPYSGGDNDASLDSSAAVKRAENGELLARFNVTLDHGYLKEYHRLADGESAGDNTWYAYLETMAESPWYNNQTYLNTLDKPSVERFVEVTHEAYLKAVGDSFGGVVPSIFTDEPQFTRKQTLSFADAKEDVTLPFTYDLADTFRAAYGEELIDHLPELLLGSARRQDLGYPLSLSRSYIRALRVGVCRYGGRLVPRSRHNADRPHDGGTYAAQSDRRAGRLLCAPIAHSSCPV